MAGSYTELPAFYDFLGKHPDYRAYAAEISETYEKIGAKESGLLLDLACGTGKLTAALMERGADVIGTDLSPEMLSVARENCAAQGFFPLLLLQDMRELDLYGTVDVAVCATNSLNYLENREELARVFALVHNFLTPGGLFFFDVNTLYKFEKLYGKNTYVFEGKGGYCVWQNDYKKSKKECDFALTIFKKEKNGLYSRVQEEQRQKYFSSKTVKELLKDAGFDLIFEGKNYKGEKLSADSADVFYLARCVKKPPAKFHVSG